MNELLWLGFAFLDMCMALALFRFFGRPGLYAIIVMNLILCNVQVLKTVELFGLTTTLGNILYAGVFLATDALNELYGPREARKGVFMGFAALVLATAIMQIGLIFTPGPDDFAQPHLEAIFGFFPRIVAASLIAFLLSQLHDVWAFHFWRRRTSGRHLWLRNNASTAVSQGIDSLVFNLIAFWGVFPWPIVWQIVLTTYLLKLFIAALDTPFLYMARRIAPAAAEAESSAERTAPVSA